MNVDSLFTVRPESHREFAVFRSIGYNRRDVAFRGSEAECYRWKKGVMKVVLRLSDYLFKDEARGTYGIGASFKGKNGEKPYHTELDFDTDKDDFILLIVSDALEAGFDPVSEEFVIEYVELRYPLAEEG